MTENKRVFIAVNLPKETKNKISKELLSIIPRKGIKPVEKENLHITLKFLGYLNEEALNEIAEKLEFAQETKKFLIELTGIGHFKKRVVWLGVKKGSEELIELSEKINEAIECAQEKFHPHVTLARNKWLKTGDVLGLLQELEKKNFFETIEAKSLDLMESVLSQSGPKYFVLKKIDFK